MFQKDSDATQEENEQNVWTWCIGITLLSFALFMSARMGIIQEEFYKTYGKHPEEALFYIVREYLV